MKNIFILSIVMLVSACSHSPKNQINPTAEAVTVRISPDYIATGRSEELRVFKYGRNTLIESQGLVKAWGKNGKTIALEKAGNYLMSESILDDFYIRHNGKVAFIELVDAKPVVHTEPLPEPPKAKPVAVKSFPQLEAFSRKQLDQYQKMMDGLASQKSTTGADLFHAQVKQNSLNEKLANHIPVAFISFDFAKTYFKPDAALDSVLIPAAIEASQVNLRGRTDSVTASKADYWISEQRAKNVKDHLINKGVDPKIITLNFIPEGDFLLPPKTQASKSINRRVEIEVVP